MGNTIYANYDLSATLPTLEYFTELQKLVINNGVITEIIDL